MLRHTQASLRLFFWCIVFPWGLLITQTGCSSAKVNMMSGYLDSTNTIKLRQYPFPYEEPTIRKYDIVRVHFGGLNPKISETLNAYGGSVSETRLNSTEGPDLAGQQVDSRGFLDFPLIGKVKAEGLTKDQLRQELVKMTLPILKDPFVSIDLPKRGVTILGEVRQPQTIVFPKERANLLEIISAVGAFDNFADLSKVKVYRELESGERMIAHLNLSDTSFFSSPFFYPRPDDVVYVPALKSKILNNKSQAFTVFVPFLFLLSNVIITLIK